MYHGVPLGSAASFTPPRPCPVTPPETSLELSPQKYDPPTALALFFVWTILQPGEGVAPTHRGDACGESPGASSLGRARVSDRAQGKRSLAVDEEARDSLGDGGGSGFGGGDSADDDWDFGGGGDSDDGGGVAGSDGGGGGGDGGGDGGGSDSGGNMDQADPDSTRKKDSALVRSAMWFSS